MFYEEGKWKLEVKKTKRKKEGGSSSNNSQLITYMEGVAIVIYEWFFECCHLH